MTYQASFITRVPAGTQEDFSSVTDGAFRIQIDDEAVEIAGVDFSQTSNYNEISTVIQQALQAIGTGGYSAATVIASSPEGSDVVFTVKSGTEVPGSYVSSIVSPLSGIGEDVSVAEYLNGHAGQYRINIDVYNVDAQDQETIKVQNDNSSEYILSVMNFYDVNSKQWSGACIEKDVVESPEYINWYNALNANTPFSERKVVQCVIDNK